MKKRIMIIILIIIAAIAGLFGIRYYRRNALKDSVSLNLYFFNNKESTLVAEEQNIKYGDRDDILDKVLEQIIKGSTKNTGIMDKKTKVNSVIKEKSHVTVDFSNDFLTDDSTKNAFAAYAVVKTLCQLPGINYVRVTVDSSEIVGPDGNLLGFMSGDDINVEKDIDGTENKYVALYFTDSKTKLLKKEIRAIKMTDLQPIEQYILNGLIEGPKNPELESVLSSDTSIISVQTTDGTCFVNFASGFVGKNSGSGEKEKNAIYSIVNSLTELDTVTNVQFLIDGKKSDSFGSVLISGMFSRNESLIEND